MESYNMSTNLNAVEMANDSRQSTSVRNDSEKSFDPMIGQECYAHNQSGWQLEDPYCDAVWDSFYCWPPTAAGTVVSRPCYVIFSSYDVDFRHKEHPFDDASAYRICDSEGQWTRGNWTNYTQCLDLLRKEDGNIAAHMAVSYILFICSFVSLLALTATLIIFCYFKSLQCSRLRVHRNLVVALIIHCVLLMIIPSSIIFQSSIPSYRDFDLLCKVLMIIKMYAAMAAINWMFVEGLLLHSRITVSVFKQDAPFKLYYFIGWGLPMVLVSSWAFVMSRSLDTPCWRGYGKSPYVWIITGPMITALLVNTVFLVNIIRILVTKLRRSVSIETTQVRKAAKATALLFPLLGITHLMFCVNPKDDAKLEEAYMISNAVLQSSQGFFVAVLYCFMNSEVQTVVRNSYLRAVIRRNPNHRYARTRSLPRTSMAFLSHTDISVAEAPRHKVVPCRKSLLPLKTVLNDIRGKKNRKAAENIEEGGEETERAYVF